jgi:hypothetical protein
MLVLEIFEQFILLIKRRLSKPFLLPLSESDRLADPSLLRGGSFMLLSVEPALAVAGLTNHLEEAIFKLLERLTCVDYYIDDICNSNY